LEFSSAVCATVMMTPVTEGMHTIEFNIADRNTAEMNTGSMTMLFAPFPGTG
jgi:hypothetical protein